MVNWVKGHIVNKRQWTDELYSLQVEAPVEPFQAGQFTRLAADIEGERIGRPYSYVNPPHRQPLEFYFITVPAGPLTNHMVELQEGDSLWVQSRAAGAFTLDQVPDAENLWLLCTGTALGVFLSILKTEQPWQRFDKVVLAHGVRTAEELTYRDDIAELQDRHPDQLRMVPLVSREPTDFAINGRITHAIEDGRLEEFANVALNAEQSQVMICGNPDMVADTSQLLEQRGLRRNRRSKPGHFTVERYW
jgi:ferredoxin--NADP+ reductase